VHQNGECIGLHNLDHVRKQLCKFIVYKILDILNVYFILLLHIHILLVHFKKQIREGTCNFWAAVEFAHMVIWHCT